MRIAVIAIGSRGDVQPYIALGLGLIKAGHTVRLATHQDFEVIVKSHGLEFRLIRGNSQETMGSQERRELSEKGNFIITVRHMLRTAECAINEWKMIPSPVRKWTCSSLAAGLTVGIPVAEKLHLPLLQAH